MRLNSFLMTETTYLFEIIFSSLSILDGLNLVKGLELADSPSSISESEEHSSGSHFTSTCSKIDC